MKISKFNILTKMVLSLNQMRMKNLATRVSSLQTYFSKIEEDLDNDLNDIRSVAMKGVEDLDAKILELQKQRCAILDERDRVCQEIQDKKNNINTLKVNMFGK